MPEGLLPYLPAESQDLLFERIHELSAPGSRIGVESDRADVADWLMDHGWRVSSEEADTLMLRYRRPPTADTTPPTMFVEGVRG